MTTPSLNPRQRLFVDHMLAGMSATAAYRAAGYTASTADGEWAGAYRLTKKPAVAAALKAAEDTSLEKHQATADRVTAGLVQLAFPALHGLFGPDGRLKPLAELPPASLLGVSLEVTSEGAGPPVVRVQSKSGDRIRALELLGRKLGMWAGAGPGEGATAEADALLTRLMLAQVERAGSGTPDPDAEPEHS